MMTGTKTNVANPAARRRVETALTNVVPIVNPRPSKEKAPAAMTAVDQKRWIVDDGRFFLLTAVVEKRSDCKTEGKEKKMHVISAAPAMTSWQERPEKRLLRRYRGGLLPKKGLPNEILLFYGDFCVHLV